MKDYTCHNLRVYTITTSDFLYRNFYNYELYKNMKHKSDQPVPPYGTDKPTILKILKKIL